MLKVLLAAIAALLLAAPVLAAPARAVTRSQPPLLLEMNRARAHYGLAPLRLDTHLQRAASFHSHEMLDANLFRHGAFAQRMARFAVTGSFAGENLAWGTGSQGTAHGIVVAWLNSPEHRANLLRPGYTRVGVADLVGSFQGSTGAHVVTADFAG